MILGGRSEIKEAYLVLFTSFSFPRLRNRLYSAVYFSIGASKNRTLDMELVYICADPNGRKLHLILQREIVKQQRDSLTTEDSWATQFIFKKEERFSTYGAGAT